MDFVRQESPPPAYSESEYDKKLSSAIQFLAISEETEEEWDDDRYEAAASSGAQQAIPSVRNRPPQSTNTNHRAVRRLPVPPHEAVPNDHPLRIHKKSASHSYTSPSTPSTSKPQPKWYGGPDEPSSARASRTNAPYPYLDTNRPRSPVTSVPFSVASSPAYPSQHHFPRPKSDDLRLNQSPIPPHSQSHPARTVPHTRAVSVSHLNFDVSVAYRSSDLPLPASAGSTRSEPNHHQPAFNPNSLYNSAVSSHLHISPSVPSRSNKPHALNSRNFPQGPDSFYTAPRTPPPPHRARSPPVFTSFQRSQSPLF
ncbi:hypothetical protein EV360DRAFT_87959 [Lentinula raphanica]|nr:hypothetical protein EV360DRAFT_87959 [Lentinula raphanica]